MTEIIDAVQLQEVDDSLVTLFEVTIPNGTVIYLFSGLVGGTANVYFPTADGTALKEYIAIPISIEGIKFASSGASHRPVLQVANFVTLTRGHANNSDGTSDETLMGDILSGNNIQRNDDFLTSKVVVRKTLFKNTYLVGDVSGFTTTLPKEFPSQTYILDRVAAENSIFVSFECASPFDVEGIKVPHREIIGKYCNWEYQAFLTKGVGGCNWQLNPANGKFFDIDNNEITLTSGGVSNQAVAAWSASQAYAVGEKVFILTSVHGTNDYKRIFQATIAGTNKSPLTHPSYWLRTDYCGKLISSCKTRFAQADRQNPSLPFGGFPGVEKFR